MKRQIRRNCFETNSSSTHAICIAKKIVNKEDLPTSVSFSHGEFGWEFATYSDTWSKASYLNEALHSIYHDKEELEEKKSYISEVLERYGVSVEFEPDEYDEYGYDSGYIDHGYETEEFIREVLNDEDKLLTYLFGNSMVITGNDNSDDYSDRMYVNEGEEVTKWGTYTNYGGLKPEFDNYEVYRKGN